jgi:hypothetical protein
MAILDLQGLELAEERSAQRRSRRSRHHCGGSHLSLLLCSKPA